MRSILGAVLAASLLVPGAAAQPLVPGKPAGVRQARMSSNHEALMIGTGVAIMTAVGLAVGGGSGAGITTGPSFPLQPVVVSTATTG